LKLKVENSIKDIGKARTVDDEIVKFTSERNELLAGVFN